MFFILSFGILKITTSKTTRSIYCPKTRARHTVPKPGLVAKTKKAITLNSNTIFLIALSTSSKKPLWRRTAQRNHINPTQTVKGLLRKRTARRVVVRSRQSSHRAAVRRAEAGAPRTTVGQNGRQPVADCRHLRLRCQANRRFFSPTGTGHHASRRQAAGSYRYSR